jgi:hypothetical protein
MRPEVENKKGRGPLQNPALRPRPVRLPVRRRAESRKTREPLHNPALRPRPVRLQVRRGAESKKARELTRNPAVLRAGGRPLAVDKRNQRAERKKARRLLQLLPVLNSSTFIIANSDGPGRTIRDRFCVTVMLRGWIGRSAGDVNNLRLRRLI